MVDRENPVVVAKQYAHEMGVLSWNHRNDIMSNFMDGYNGTVNSDRDNWHDGAKEEYDHAYKTGESFRLSQENC